MTSLILRTVFAGVLFSLHCHGSYHRNWVTTDEFENHVSPEDLKEFLSMYHPQYYHNQTETTTPADVDYAEALEDTGRLPIPEFVDCFGLGSISRQILLLFNMRPDTSDTVNTHFYFSSRKKPNRVQVHPGPQFGLEWVDFDPKRKSVMIVHGFMSHSNASWVIDMTRAFLEWDDVNVIVVDWSGGGNTWKYWRAVANTRTVGSDVTWFLRQLMDATGAKAKGFHFVGHSLGAHISSFVSYHLGGVSRITGLDPAQPCFRTASDVERLDPTDADFVDVIHTNGRLMSNFGFGLPNAVGHADFYSNGGMKQPGCLNGTNSLFSRLSPFAKLQRAICNHGRAYLLFTESLINKNCSFTAFRWNLTYDGVNATLKAACDRKENCAEMGIRAIGGDGVPRANGTYFALTNEKFPYCPTVLHNATLLSRLLWDLQRGFEINKAFHPTTAAAVTEDYADPMAKEVETTTKRGWLWFWRRFG